MLKSKKSAFEYFYIFFAILMIVNFYLTKSPYAALHSGNAGGEFSYVTNFFINPANIIIIVALFIVILTKHIYVDYLLLFMILAINLPALVSGLYFEGIKSYIYDTLMILIVYSISSYDLKNKISLNTLDRKKIFLIFLIFLGLSLAIIYPNIYGYLPFEFSRSSRGEVTLWNVLSLIKLFPALIFSKNKISKFELFTFLVLYLVTLSTYSRNGILVLSLMGFMYFYLKDTSYKKLFISTFLICLVALFYNEILSFFTLSNVSSNSNTSWDVILNGRDELWGFYFNSILEHPILGNGIGFLSKDSRYMGTALSEVGLLKWFAEYGVVYGTIITILVVVVTIYVLRNLKKMDRYSKMIGLIFLISLTTVLQHYGRILNMSDFLFWYSLFYLYHYKNENKNKGMIISI